MLQGAQWATGEWELVLHLLSWGRACIANGEYGIRCGCVFMSHCRGSAREIQAQESVSNIWGPPTSSNSTPLRENIPESPNQDYFPDLMPAGEPALPNTRRTRAGTVPSRFPPVGTLNGLTPTTAVPTGTTSAWAASKSSGPPQSTSPFRPVVPGIDTNLDTNPTRPGAPAAGNGFMSRIRAGSLPQSTNRPSFLGSSNPFGPSLFSTNWPSGRTRASTLASIRSSESPASPQSAFSKDGLVDSDVKTLDYLGLAEPQQPRSLLSQRSMDPLLPQSSQASSTLPPNLVDLSMMNKGNRFRSYSVNAKEKYADDEEEEAFEDQYSALPSGALTPSMAAAAQLAATQVQIHQHNLAVQAFANHASVSRPRARTAGVLDAPPQRSSIRNYLATPSRLDYSLNMADLHIAEGAEYEDLPESMQMLQLNGLAGLRPPQETSDENGLEGPTRALWIGSIPVSTTVSSLDVIFKTYGEIESARVLTHKNCGFVNYKHIDSAIQAKNHLDGKEIFPGAGPVRIGFAKVPTSGTGTPLIGGIQPSSTPDPNTSGLDGSDVTCGAASSGNADGNTTHPEVPSLPELEPEILQIVAEFGATEDESRNMAVNIHNAIEFNAFEAEIPPIPEPSQTRVHDAPKLRDIRKRIDNGAYSIQEIEDIAIGMLPEIAELSSDYLGNTVVQKLFEYCSEPTKERMLVEIAPHLAEIGIHKNGTWAAQKIIDVAKTIPQKKMIVDNLRPHTVSLFLDQYGNYVLQCCLRFGPPYNDFIFETMLSRMWELAQGRFGARAMRACLESHHTTRDQQRMLAAAISLHSVQLATNSNGALLLTWFLDTCTFLHRRTVLAPRLVPHLVHLCTHKVAYLTVLKVINQRNEPEARSIVLKALFFSPGDETLEKILRDQSSGATLIFKVITTPSFDEAMRAEVVKNVAKILTKLKVMPNQGYKRLMDEVGLSSRNGPRDGRSPDKQQRPSSRAGYGQTLPPYGGQFANTPPTLAAPVPAEPIPPYDLYGVAGINNLSPLANPGFPAQEPLMTVPQQLQYQAYLNPQTRGVAPAAFYPFVGGTTNGINPATTYGPTSAAPSASSLDAFRAMQSSPMPTATTTTPHLNGSSMLQPQFAPGTQYNTPPGMGIGTGPPRAGATPMYAPYPAPYTGPAQGQALAANAGRRARVSPLAK